MAPLPLARVVLLLSRRCGWCGSWESVTCPTLLGPRMPQSLLPTQRHNLLMATRLCSHVHTAPGVPQELPFLPSPTPGFNPTQWTPTQRSEYAKSTLLFNTLPNVIFFGMAVILLAMFLIW